MIYDGSPNPDHSDRKSRTLNQQAVENVRRRLHRPLQKIKQYFHHRSSPSLPTSGLDTGSNAPRRQSNNPRLCEACQKWNDVEKIFQLYTKENWFRLPLDQMLGNQKCIFCSAVAPAVVEKFQDAEDRPPTSDIIVHIKSAFSMTPNHLHHLDPSFDIQGFILREIEEGRLLKCVFYLLIRKISDPKAPISWTPGESPDIGAQLLLGYDRSSRHLERVETWDTPLINITLVKGWINSCENGHRDTCLHDPGFVPPGFRLIDIQNMCIVESKPPQGVAPRFVALSYMWHSPLDQKDLQLSQRNMNQLKERGSLVLSEIPDLISDSIRLCNDLGERYLWVDKLCIIQDDVQSQQVQIDAMDAIYGMAIFTIIAAIEGTRISGLPGVRGRPRCSFVNNNTQRFQRVGSSMDFNFDVTVDQSTWNMRGWTFQERALSTRCVYVTDYQVYFTCSKLICQESLGVIPRKSFWLRTAQYHIPDISTMGDMSSYTECVSHYSTRIFTYEDDILNAFAGVANKLSKNMKTTFLHGIPEKYLLEGLLWYPSDDLRPRKGVPHIPSWSWAAWSGQIIFMNRELPYWFEVGTMINYYIEDSRCGLRRLEIEETWFGDFEKFDDRRSRCGDVDTSMSYMSDSAKSTDIWQSCPQKPWERVIHDVFDPDVFRTARDYPQCLVFNTTVASLCLKAREMDSGEKGMIAFDICNQERQEIGFVELPPSWEVSKDLDGKVDCVVLCAGVLEESKRRDIFHAQLFEQKDLDKDPWLLKVMLVERREEAHVCRRIAIGHVQTRLWATASPRWETVILT